MLTQIRQEVPGNQWIEYLMNPPEEIDLKCLVCFNGDSEVDNEVVICSKCDIAVHQACYGITSVPEEDWYCSPCSKGLDKPACVLCPIPGGAVKPLQRGDEWAHVLCALWTPGVSIGDPVTMEPICSVDKVDPDRFKLQCSLCKIHSGSSIQCSHPNCYTAFHPSCAFLKHQRMEVIELEHGKEFGVELGFISYCEKHKDTFFDEKAFLKQYEKIPKQSKRHSRANMSRSHEPQPSPPPEEESDFWLSINSYFSDPFDIPDRFSLPTIDDSAFMIPPRFQCTRRECEEVSDLLPKFHTDRKACERLGLRWKGPSEDLLLLLRSQESQIVMLYHLNSNQKSRPRPRHLFMLESTSSSEYVDPNLYDLQKQLFDQMKVTNDTIAHLRPKLTHIPECPKPLLEAYRASNRNQYVRISLSNGIKDPVDPLDVPESVCQACFDGHSHNRNPIVFCEGCDHAVHKHCYGISEVPEDDWFCLQCSKNVSTATCSVCNCKGGLFLQQSGRWVHASCSLWGLHGTSNDVKALCKICSSNRGTVVQCGNRKCSQYFHLRCAWNEGFELHMDISNERWTITPLCAQHCDSKRDTPCIKLYREKLLFESHFISTQNLPQADTYESDRCAICFRSGGSFQSCSKCNIFVHSQCLPSEHFKCLCCQDPFARDCLVCPRKGGALVVSGSAYIHIACVRWLPSLTFARGKVEGLKSNRGQYKCILCGSSEGMCLQCADQNCFNRFHVLCGFFSGTCSIPLRDGLVLCPEHTPLLRYRTTELPENYLRLMTLRKDLDKARTVLDLVRRREKFKKRLLRVDLSILKASEPSTCKKRKVLVFNNPLRIKIPKSLLLDDIPASPSDSEVTDSEFSNGESLHLYARGDRVLALQKGEFFEARVLRVIPEDPPLYRVHYFGFNHRHDETVPESSIKPIE